MELISPARFTLLPSLLKDSQSENKKAFIIVFLFAYV